MGEKSGKGVMKDHLVTLVRVLIGLPVTAAYLYVRHFDETYAYLLLAVGLMILMAALRYEMRYQAAVSVQRRRP
jgi:hypothetical protein